MRVILIDMLAACSGGQVTRAKAFLERLRTFDPNSRVLIVKEDGLLPFCDSLEGAKIIRVSLGPGRLKAVKRMLWSTIFLPQIIKKYKVGTYITFSHYLPLTFPKNTLSIVGISNIAPFSKEAWRSETSSLKKVKMLLLKNSIIHSAKFAGKVVALSNKCKDLLVDNGIPRNKIIVVPNGVEKASPQPGSATMANHGINGDFILFVSHFHRHKNFIRLLEAYSLLPLEIKNQYYLVLIGEPQNKKYFADVLTAIDKFNLDSRAIVIPGLKQRELLPVYSQASLFVFPTLIENSPNILLEAMSHGAPVLTSRIDPMPEFAGDAAVYFDPLSAADIAKKIKAALKDKGLIAKMKKSSVSCADKYSWDCFTSEIIKLYR